MIGTSVDGGSNCSRISCHSGGHVTDAMSIRVLMVDPVTGYLGCVHSI